MLQYLKNTFEKFRMPCHPPPSAQRFYNQPIMLESAGEMLEST
jgi:hypothetical protein